jgi:acetyl esterase/lipase
MAADTAVSVREIIKLWDGAPPTHIPNVPPEIMTEVPAGIAEGTTFIRNVSEPTLTVYEPAPGKANGVGVIVCPGGGWSILAWIHEGIQVAEWFAERGYTAFLLKYRLSATAEKNEDYWAAAAESQAALLKQVTSAKRARQMSDIIGGRKELLFARDVAAEDGRRALALVHEQAAKRKLDSAKIGMIGFSAGAFLVADVAIDPRGVSPAFVAPIYGGETSGRPVPAGAPPMFIAIAQDDVLLLSIVEGLYQDWSAAKRSVEFHLYARGAHGFGMLKQGMPSDRWVDALAAWLADNGFG